MNDSEKREMIDLTKRQNEILDFIKVFLFMNGYPPTREEIATKFGFVSVNAAQCHLIALKVKGYITVAPGVSRGIALTNLGTKTKTILRMTA